MFVVRWFGGKDVGVARGQTRKCALSAEKYARSAHFFGVGYEGGGLCRGWEALAGYLGGLSCRQGRGVPHTPPSATIGGEYMFHIRPLRVRLRGRMRYAPTAGYPAKLRRRPQTPPKQRGRHAPSETPVSAACWRTTRRSASITFRTTCDRQTPPQAFRQVSYTMPPSTMLPSVGGCGRRRSLPGTRKACTRPYSLRGAPRHLHSHQPHGTRRWRDPLRARNAGQRTLPGTHSPYTGIWPNFAGVRRRPVAPWTQEAGTTPGLHRHRRPRGGDEMSHNEERIR